MTRQWIRQCRLMIGNGSEAVDVSDLRIRFNVQRATTPTPEQADIIITNLSNATANRIVSDEYKNVVLQAGYDGNFDTIFEGEIVQRRGPGRESPTDTYVNLLVKGGQLAVSYGVVNKTLAAGHTIRDQVDACLEALKPYGIVAGHISDLGSTKMPRGRAMFGMVRNQLRSICNAVGATWWIEGKKLNILSNKENMPGDAIVINSGTGMIGMPVQTIDGVEVRCLLNPRINLGSVLKIDEASIQRAKYSLDNVDSYLIDQKPLYDSNIASDGLYQVKFMSHSGDTRGTDWYTDSICIALHGGIPSKRVSQTSLAPTLGGQ
ncbi:phage protein [Xanthobacter flavus]|uniref:phage protein n=1 Tax=Xanthobacter flavus TaxID=281 RepID=UPI00372D0AC9